MPPQIHRFLTSVLWPVGPVWSCLCLLLALSPSYPLILPSRGHMPPPLFSQIRKVCSHFGAFCSVAFSKELLVSHQLTISSNATLSKRPFLGIHLPIWFSHHIFFFYFYTTPQFFLSCILSALPPQECKFPRGRLLVSLIHYILKTEAVPGI